MAETEAQRRANVKWRSENVRRMTVAFYPKDNDLLAWMDRHAYRGAWLAGLARREFERELKREERTEGPLSDYGDTAGQDTL